MRLKHFFVILGCSAYLVGCPGGSSTSCGVLMFPNDYVSRASDASATQPGAPADGEVGPAAASADGRFVAFTSVATNLVAPPTDQSFKVYVRDTCAGAPAGCVRKTVLATTGPSNAAPTGCGRQLQGTAAMPSVSADGRYVAFAATCDLGFQGVASTIWQIYVRDLCTSAAGFGTVSGCTPGTWFVTNGSLPSYSPTLSSDGKTIAFMTADPPVLDGSGAQVHGKQIVVTSLASCPAGGGSCVMGSNARIVSQTAQGNYGNSGTQGSGNSEQPRMSPDGRYVAFVSTDKNLFDAAFTPLNLGGPLQPMQLFIANTCVGAGPSCKSHAVGPFSSTASAIADADVRLPSISNVVAPNVLVTFESKATNLGAALPSGASLPVGVSQVYLLGDGCAAFPEHLCTSHVKILSTDLTRLPGNASSYGSQITADGQTVFMSSAATNFTPAGTGGVPSVYATPTCLLVGGQQPQGCIIGAVGLSSPPPGCAHPNAGCEVSGVAANRQVYFYSTANNLLPGVAQGLYSVKP